MSKGLPSKTSLQAAAATAASVSFLILIICYLSWVYIEPPPPPAAAAGDHHHMVHFFKEGRMEVLDKTIDRGEEKEKERAVPVGSEKINNTN